jgi:hypothetical protein
MELFQELGDGDGGEVVGLHRFRRKVIQGFIYLSNSIELFILRLP